MRLQELREELAERERPKPPPEKDDAPDFYFQYGDEGRLQKVFRDGHTEEMWPYPHDPWQGLAGYD